MNRHLKVHGKLGKIETYQKIASLEIAICLIATLMKTRFKKERFSLLMYMRRQYEKELLFSFSV
jgi:hypothetical protein